MALGSIAQRCVEHAGKVKAHRCLANIQCGPYLHSSFSGQSSAGPTSRWKKLLVGVLVIGVAGAAGMSHCMVKYTSCRQMFSFFDAWSSLLISAGGMLTAP